MYATTAPNVNPLVTITNSRSASHLLDNTSYLANQKVYMFSGREGERERKVCMFEN